MGRYHSYNLSPVDGLHINTSPLKTITVLKYQVISHVVTLGKNIAFLKDGLQTATRRKSKYSETQI